MGKSIVVAGFAAAALALASCASQSGSAANEKWAAEVFARMRTLEGDWTQTPESPMKAETGIRYHVVGGGSAVVQTLFPGAPHEMVSVFHMDRGALVGTHYCAAGNQPSYRAEPTSDPNQVRWVFVGLSNGDPAVDMHMHEGLTTFVDADHVRESWQGWDKGAASPDHLAEFDSVRAK